MPVLPVVVSLRPVPWVSPMSLRVLLIGLLLVPLWLQAGGLPAAAQDAPAGASGSGAPTAPAMNPDSPSNPDATSAEVRAVWISNAVLGRLGGPAGVMRLLDELAEANVNVILPEAVFRGYTLYPGPYQDPRFAAWSVDPLEVIAHAAHLRGMEVHPWVWVFAAGLDAAPGPILAAHPQWAECPPGADVVLGLEAARSAPPPAAGRTLWLSPAVPEARAFLIREFLEILRRYPVDGLHLDYIRYSETPCGDGVPRASLARYAAETGRDPAAVVAAAGAGSAAAREEAMAWHLWREAQVSAFVRDLSAAMRAENPSWVLTAAVTPEIREARYLRWQDWEHWLANGWVDYVFPMAYASNVRLVRTMMASWDELGPLVGRIVPGLLVSANTPEALLEQMEAVRSAAVAGVALFAADHLLPSHLRALRSGPFAAATVPFRDDAGEVRRPPAPAAFVPPKEPPVFAAAPRDQDAPGTNLAAAARVTVDSAFRGYGPGPLTDGRRNDEIEIGRWAEVAWASAETPDPHWIELAWDDEQRIARVDIYWARDRDQFHSSRSYRVEAWVNGEWQVLFAHESPTGSTRVTRHSISFVPVATDRLRVFQPPGGGPAGRPDLMWVAEVEVYGP
ncbi:MAG TPA: family 10 glycosylhydrolase [Limnochordales bacterium]